MPAPGQPQNQGYSSLGRSSRPSSTSVPRSSSSAHGGVHRLRGFSTSGAAVLTPRDLGLVAQDAGAGSAARAELNGHERADIDPHAVVDVRLPANRLFAERLPAHEEIAGRFAGDYLLELVLKIMRSRQSPLRTVGSSWSRSAFWRAIQSPR